MMAMKDEDLVEVLVSKVYETADIKPQKAEDLQADVDHALNYKFTDVVADGEIKRCSTLHIEDLGTLLFAIV